MLLLLQSPRDRIMHTAPVTDSAFESPGPCFCNGGGSEPSDGCGHDRVTEDFGRVLLIIV